MQFGQAFGGSHPDASLAVFPHVENDAPSERIRRKVVCKAPGVHAAQTFTRGHQQVALTIFPDRENFIARQSVSRGVGLEPAIREVTKAADVEAHPDPAIAVLIYGSRFVAGESLAG